MLEIGGWGGPDSSFDAAAAARHGAEMRSLDSTPSEGALKVVMARSNAAAARET